MRGERFLGWGDIYRRLVADCEDTAAWLALARRIGAGAQSDLWQLGHDTVDYVVADVCAEVAVTIERAHGPETFGGFVLGHYLNARRQAIRAASRTSINVDDIELASEIADD